MYIKKVEISNIRSIDHFSMDFPDGQEAGWHVLIGDNGTGKSTIIRSIALALLDQSDISATRENWENWLGKSKKAGHIQISFTRDLKYDQFKSQDPIDNDTNEFTNRISFSLITQPAPEPINEIKEEIEMIDGPGIFNVRWGGIEFVEIDEIITRNKISFIRSSSKQVFSQDSRIGAWFSVAYGPLRRFTGGNTEKERLYLSNPRLGAHLSAFGEDVALSEALTYLTKLYILSTDNKYRNREKNIEGNILEGIINFLNKSQLLPNGVTINELSPNFVTFKDANNNQIQVTEMSDGYRSIISLFLELIRQLITFYGYSNVFNQISQNKMVIDLPGIVLIDEIDAHLHPTWQTKIGQWFRKYFPKIQFIVTTHSPLVCRAAETGSIWRLTNKEIAQELIAGLDRDRLIYGNILDAYGTEVFGSSIERSVESTEKLQRLAQLSQLNAYGKLTVEGKEEMNMLKKILITDDTTTY